MSAGFFEVDTNLLNRDISELEQLIKELRSRLSEMESSVQAVSSTWEGPSKVAFTEQVTKDSEFFSNYLNEVTTFLDKMQTASKEYDSCESEVLDVIQSIQI